MTTTNTTTSIFDSNNREQMNAYKLIAETNQSFFLTGRAGTGKTTFINNVLANVKKNFVVLAPTGKAALLIGGSTIHSYFGFKPGEITPHTLGSSRNLANLSYVDTFIVDEVSMLRCDWVDAMDYTLRHALHSSLPFGGKQVVFCGDLFQLPPVVQKHTADVEMLQTEYGTTDAYFYKAHAFKYLQLPKIEFCKVYRQKDADFLNILDHIRTGECIENEVEALNKRVVTPTSEDGPYVILSGLKKQVEKINKEFLDAIDSKGFTYKSETSGNFPKNDNDLPADDELTLKVGAQIMFCKNDRNGRWVNGTLGKVTSLSDDKIVVMIDNDEVTVEKTSWEKTVTTYNRETKKMEKEVVGIFVQYPIRLAWAMTIHKSQGATFDRMLLDLKRGGIFADGQLYVALTRVRNLDSLYLNAPIKETHIRKNYEVNTYSETFNDADIISRASSVGKELYDLRKVYDFDAMATVYLRETLDSLIREDVEAAYCLSKNMMQTMISDEMLYGATASVPECPSSVAHSDWFNAIFCLYGNKFEQACQYADNEWRETGDPDMLYVKIRALSMLKRYREADSVFENLIQAVDDDWDFKTAYALALHNELCVEDPGLGIMQQVVVKHIKYRTGLLRFRELLRRKGLKLRMADEITNPLAIAFNSDMSDEEFVDSVAKSVDANAWVEFKAIVKKQVL